MTKRKFSAYINYGAEKLWTIIILDHEWWNDNFFELTKWFNLNCPGSIPLKNQYMFSFKTTEQYTMWRLAWEN